MFRYAIPKFPASDVRASLEFYKNKMGFAEVFDYGDYAAAAGLGPKGLRPEGSGGGVRKPE